MQVVLIEYEDHSVIGVTLDVPTAIQCLIENHWIDSDTPIYEESGVTTVEERFGENWREALIAMDDATFNEIMAEQFFVSIEDVWGTT